MNESVTSPRGGEVTAEYHEVPPTRWTFEPPAVRQFVERHLSGRVLNLFAGRTKLRHDGKVVRNDLDAGRDADRHFDATEVSRHVADESFDTVVLDPPYSIRKSREKYNGEYQGATRAIKDQLATIVRPGGHIIHFGYDTTGMGRARRFKKLHIGVFCHKGDHNDTLAVIDRRMDTDVTGFGGESA